MADKSLKRYITFCTYSDHAYLDPIMAKTEAEAAKRFQPENEDDHFWDGVKFIHIPIEIRIPNELEHLVKEDFV